MYPTKDNINNTLIQSEIRSLNYSQFTIGNAITLVYFLSVWYYRLDQYIPYINNMDRLWLWLFRRSSPVLRYASYLLSLHTDLPVEVMFFMVLSIGGSKYDHYWTCFINLSFLQTFVWSLICNYYGNENVYIVS